jgi:hypothetical protein
VLLGRVAQRREPGGQVLLGDPLRQVDVVDALLLEPHQDAAFDLDEADLAAGAVEAGQFLVDDADEPGVDDLEPLAALGLAPVDQAPESFAPEGLDPAADRVGETLFLTLSPASSRRTRCRSMPYSKVSWRAMASIRLVRLAPKLSPKGEKGSPSRAIKGCPSRYPVSTSRTTSSLSSTSDRIVGVRLLHHG